MSFKDHFSGHAKQYAEHRPTYPTQLFSWLASLTQGRQLAWDCATGNGQAALQLAEYYQTVLATDASEQQLRHRASHPRVTYQVEPAETCSCGASTVDLVTVAQALHWFDLDRFYSEVSRVLKPNGVLATWGYGLASISPGIDEMVQRYYRQVEEFWPPERRWVEDCYQSLPFPFDEIQAPDFAMETGWSCQEYVAYLRTWSATRRAEQAMGQNPLQGLLGELERAWGAETKRRVRWPMFFRVGTPGRVPQAGSTP